MPRLASTSASRETNIDRPGFVTSRVGNPVISRYSLLSRFLQEAAAMTQSFSEELNLTTHRASVSVWDRRGWDGSREQRTPARWLVGLGGGALAVQGLRQRSVAGTLLAGFGASLAWWALAGEGDLSEPQRWLARVLERAPWHREDLVHEASADSFPASDAPAWTPTVGAGLPRRGTHIG